jgi:hypothetical protein
VPREDLTALAREVEKQIGDASSPDAIRAALTAVGGMIRAFVNRFVTPAGDLLAEEERLACGSGYYNLVNFSGENC